MGSLELDTPYPQNSRSKEEEEEESPIEEVRLTVTNTDDPTLPVWTFRMWFLGLLSCVMLSFLNQFFAYRTEPLVITQITVQVASLPIGHFMAAVLPKAKFRLPGFGSRQFSLNPGPFNMKEHVLITIFANAGSAFGSGSAYAVNIVTIVKAFYKRKISFLAGWLLIITTQVSLSLTHTHIIVNVIPSRHHVIIKFEHFAGTWIWLGWAFEEVCNPAGPYVVARNPRPGFTLPVSFRAHQLTYFYLL